MEIFIPHRTKNKDSAETPQIRTLLSPFSELYPELSDVGAGGV